MPRPKLIAPCGGTLVDLTVAPDELEHAKSLPAVHLSERAVCDLELLATGAFSPLDRFMGSADYERVVHEMRLENGHLFPIPITLPVADDEPIKLDGEVSLRDSRNDIVATMTVEEKIGRASCRERV